MKKPILFIILITFSLFLYSKNGRTQVDTDSFIPGKLLVRFEPDISKVQIKEFLSKYKCHIITKIKIGDCSIYSIKLPEGLDVKSAIDIFLKENIVKTASPDLLFDLDTTQIYLDQTRQLDRNTHIFNPWQEAYDYVMEQQGQDSKEVILVIFDTGLKNDYIEALRPYLWTNQAEVTGLEGQDDDNLSFNFQGENIPIVDDVYGYDFIDLPENYFELARSYGINIYEYPGEDYHNWDGDFDDKAGHGTNMTYIASSFNFIPQSGYKVMVIKAGYAYSLLSPEERERFNELQTKIEEEGYNSLTSEEQSEYQNLYPKSEPRRKVDLQALLLGMQYALEIAKREDARLVMNMSFHRDGERFSRSQPENYALFHDIMQEAAKEAVIVASAGDNYYEPDKTKPQIPAAFDFVLGVGGINTWGEVTDSTFRSPSADVYTWQDFAIYNPYTNEEWIAGTSVSATIVSSLCSLMLIEAPDLSTNEIRQLVKETALPLSGEDAGQVDFIRAVKTTRSYDGISKLISFVEKISEERKMPEREKIAAILNNKIFFEQGGVSDDTVTEFIDILTKAMSTPLTLSQADLLEKADPEVFRQEIDTTREIIEETKSELLGKVAEYAHNDLILLALDLFSQNYNIPYEEIQDTTSAEVETNETSIENPFRFSPNLKPFSGNYYENPLLF